MEGLIARPPLLPASSTLLIVDEQSQIGAARRTAVSLGHTLKLEQEAIGRLAIVVTEAATNMVRHAGRGVIALRALLAGDAIEVLALDKGPGIADIARARRDGFSTAGTPGNGLGAIERLSDVFEIYSRPGMGTAVLARIRKGPLAAKGAVTTATLDDRVGAVCVPLRGEIESGDAWRIVVNGPQVAVLLVDGLGHGPGAAAAAGIATTTFGDRETAAPEALLGALHIAMRDTRGAAVSVAVIDETARNTRFAGVGNVDGRVLAATTEEHLVPQNGIVGHAMPTVRAKHAEWPVGARLVMHSDGISARWRMSAYPGLGNLHPALQAGVIFRDFGRARDDATILVVSDRPARESRR